jgi:hypothetical protein
MTRRIFAGLAALAMLAGASAKASPSLSFSIGGATSTGSITYAGGATDLIGSGLAIGRVTGVSTPLHAGSGVGNRLTVDTTGPGDGFYFTTGAYTGTDGSGNLLFAPGGTVGLLGAVTAPAAATLPGGTPLLFNGSFIDTVKVSNTGNGAELIGTVSLTNLNASVAAWFGLPAGSTYTGGIAINFGVTTVGVTGGTAFSSDPNQDISTLDNVSPTPEPGTIGMACTAAVAGLLYGLRRARKPVQV